MNGYIHTHTPHTHTTHTHHTHTPHIHTPHIHTPHTHTHTHTYYVLLSMAWGWLWLDQLGFLRWLTKSLQHFPPRFKFKMNKQALPLETKSWGLTLMQNSKLLNLWTEAGGGCFPEPGRGRFSILRLSFKLFFPLLNCYLFIWLCQVLVAAGRI